MNDALEGIVTAELEPLGFDVVELRRGGSKRRPVFDVRIERRDLTSVTVDDCARVSRAIEARLEREAGLAGVAYVLEVSSPGMDRKLLRAADWTRFTGRRALVKSAALGGPVEVEIVGLEGEPGTETVMVRDGKGIVHRVALNEVAEARLAVHWP